MTGDGLGRGLSDMWRSILLFLPTALAFIAILVIGYVLARLLRTAVAKGLHKAGFDRAVDRGVAGRVLKGSRTGPSDLCAKIVYYAVLLFALQFAFGIWGPNPVSDLLTALISWLPRLFVAVVIVVVAAAIAGAVHDLIASALGGLGYGRVIARAASVVIVALGVIAALDQVQIATSVTRPLLIAVLATVAGVVIIGVGGGLIRPMQHRWEGWLERAGTESAAIREHAKAYADERARVEEERKAEEARQAEELRRAEEARAAERARVAEEARRAEEARIADEARRDELRRADEEARRAEEVRRAEDARAASAAATDASPSDETQVITPPRPRRVTESAFDAERAPDPDDTATVVTGEAGDTTIVNPSPNETLVIGSGAEDVDRTQVITPPESVKRRESAETQVLPQGRTPEVSETQTLPPAAVSATQTLPPTSETQTLPPTSETQTLPPTSETQTLPPTSETQTLPPTSETQALPEAEADDELDERPRGGTEK